MKLLIITRENASDRRYGLGRSTQAIADYLSDAGHEVHYLSKAEFTTAHQNHAEALAKKLHWLLGGLSPAMSERIIQGYCCARQLQSLQPTHIWLHDPWLLFGLQLGALRSRFKLSQYRLIISEHGLGSFARAVTLDGLSLTQRQMCWLHRFERWALNRANLVLCPSTAVIDLLQRDLGLPEAPPHWQVLGYGQSTPPGIPKAEARQTLGLQADTPIILAVGRLSPVKRYDIIFDTIKRVQQSGIPCQLLVAGDGDPRVLAALQEKYPHTHPAIIRTFEDMDPVYAAADVFLSACSHESFGLASREAVAAGLPCVVATGGGADTVLGSGAWLMPASAEIMSEALAQLLCNTDTYHFWQQQSLATGPTFANWSILGHQYETQLQQL